MEGHNVSLYIHLYPLFDIFLIFFDGFLFVSNQFLIPPTGGKQICLGFATVQVLWFPFQFSGSCHGGFVTVVIDGYWMDIDGYFSKEEGVLMCFSMFWSSDLSSFLLVLLLVA